MTPKQQRFVEEYGVDSNATQAAIRAGYSAKTAEQQGYQLLQNTSVAAAIAERAEKLSQKLEITAERVLRELALIGFANMSDYITIGSDGDPFVDLSMLDRDKAAAISEVMVEDFKDGRGENARDVRKVKFKLSDKRAALVDLGRHLKLFTDNLNVKVDVPEEVAEWLGNR